MWQNGINKKTIIANCQFVALLALLLALLPLVHADELNFKTLLMPGKLVEGHAKLESDCGNCHVSFAKQTQDQLCVKCHDIIAADINANKGFHGKLGRDTALVCKQCHTDHKGRGADITGLDRDNFKHDGTNFPLLGKHAEQACTGCHQPGKKFRSAANTCVACHKAVDRHRGALGEQCGNCHNPSSWKQTRFDHATTQFALRGGHQQVSCGSCHPSERFKKTPTECVACHAINDVHGGNNGRDCQRCHNESNWKKATFDHARDAHFALRGKHAEVACNSCHKDSKFATKLTNTCSGCHRADDTHKGKNGDHCDSCHSESTWTQQKFDHNRTTQFALRGKHSAVACTSCHRGNLHDVLPKSCSGCHRGDDVHKGQQGEQCERCHNESGWKDKVAFDHQQSQFPLTGLHAAVPCDACHISSAFKGADKRCVGCHKADDKHKGAFGADCAQCHNSGGWRKNLFDHNKQTQFALSGAHAKLVCADCHRQPADKVKLPKDCFSCHASDDEHDGKFGRNCERCHNSSSFKQVDMRR